jgi:Asp-tRNA(Asn)/Glu-tRNA(Gln) amidotransferase A subunit family amidase
LTGTEVRVGASGLNTLSATDIARRIGAGDITAEAVVTACLARIEEREPAVHAWSFVDADLALRQARACDAGPRRGPLHGVPIGIKDVLDTADMPTEMGSAIYKGYRPKTDASCVALARAAGAIVLGKTVTSEFAGLTPGPTTNPHNPAHTPGGSSSGSAAAVADVMVPLAFGTQTGGSILRPASFCGVIGYKPSYNAFNRAGLKFAAESLDTIGVLARTIDDVELLSAVLVGRAPEPAPMPSARLRVGLCRTPLWQSAQPETVEAVEDAAVRLAQAGAVVRECTLPDPFKNLGNVREAVNDYERAHAMAWEWEHHRNLISERLRKVVQHGFEIPHDDYRAALRLIEGCRAALTEVFKTFDVLLAPCVAGEAPRGLDSTGDTQFQAYWTMLHVPTLCLPTHRGPSGLPVAIQIVAPVHADTRLFGAARWILEHLGPGKI